MIDLTKMLWVQWVDSAGTSGWKAESDLKARHASIIESVGFVVEDTDAHLILVQNVDKEPAHLPGYGDYGSDSITIPIEAIKARRPLKFA